MSEQLRRGWTTGACAAAAAKAAFSALRGDGFPDPVEIGLPRGGRVAFALAETGFEHRSGHHTALAGVVKDAGDDPDVTHGALIQARIWAGAAGSGVAFRAGTGVGTVTRPGLALPVGEPAINPVPRAMIAAALREVHHTTDVIVEIAVPGGELLGQRTLNSRLGIIGGLSILGTTGIVVPYSCAAWIDTIHRGIDVARALGIAHVAGSTGSVSEAAAAALHGLPEVALLEMGDFAGGMLKYLRTHPIPRVSIAGGVAKMSKLAQGRLDLHSKRGSVDMDALASLVPGDNATLIAQSNTVAEAFSHCPELADRVASRAWNTAATALSGAPIELEILVIDRTGRLVGRAPFQAVPAAPGVR